MILGVNLLRPSSFERYRPFNNEALQATPWWRTADGGWGSKHFPRIQDKAPRRNELYRSIIADNGACGAGPFVFSRSSSDIELRGEFKELDNGHIMPQPGKTLWVEFQSSVERSDFPTFQLIRPNSNSAEFKSDFVIDLESFDAVRTMDWDGAFSHRKYAKGIIHAHTAHLTSEDGSAEWFDHHGIHPHFIRTLPSGKVWMNMPLHIATRKNEAIKWMEQRMVDGVEYMLSVANEASWNWQFPLTKYLHEQAQSLRELDSNGQWVKLHENENVARIILYLRVVERVFDYFVGVPNIRVVAELQNADHWAAEGKSWMPGNPAVSTEVRRILKKVGHVAVAPYYANGQCPDTEVGYGASMVTPLSDLDRWIELGRLIGFQVHIYECGPHNHDNSAQSQTPEMGRSLFSYLDEINSRLDSNSWCMLYALGGSDPWGLVPVVGGESVKMAAVKAWMFKQAA